jgi:hypothetical protein
MPDGGWPLLPFRFRRRFVFQKRLGGGGMGAVFLAIDEDAPTRGCCRSPLGSRCVNPTYRARTA